MTLYNSPNVVVSDYIKSSDDLKNPKFTVGGAYFFLGWGFCIFIILSLFTAGRFRRSNSTLYDEA